MGETLARISGLDGKVGTLQLLTGTASLEEATQTLLHAPLEVITAGAGVCTVDGDTAAMLLDALDESYDFVVVLWPSVDHSRAVCGGPGSL